MNHKTKTKPLKLSPLEKIHLARLLVEEVGHLMTLRKGSESIKASLKGDLALIRRLQASIRNDKPMWRRIRRESTARKPKRATPLATLFAA